MNRILLALLACVLGLCGCTTLNDRDQRFLQSHGVLGTVYEKMLHHEPLSLDDIVKLSQKGIPGPFIVYYLRPTYAVYNLSEGDVMRLRGAGVREGVIHYLSATPGMFNPGSVPLIYQDYPPAYDPYDPYRIRIPGGYY